MSYGASKAMGPLRDRSTLYGHQQKIVRFIKDHPRCAIWADMGLGKTGATLTAIADLIDGFECRKALVVAPLRVARKVWSDEAKEWSHLEHLTFAKMVGSRPTRRTALVQPGDIHMINRENLAWLVDTYFHDNGKQKRYWPYDTVVLDESQSFMNQGTARWKAIRQVNKLFPRMIQLTGTPAPKGYAALWSQVFLLDRGKRLGSTESAFKHRWFNCDRGDGYSTWRLKESAAGEIQEKISDIVLSLRVEDYFDLPSVNYNPVRVAMRAKDLALYRKMERQYLVKLASERVVTAVNAGVCAGKLLQLANGFVYPGDGEKYEPFHDEKVEALLETLEQSNGPVLIAHNFVADRDRICAALKKFCKPWQKWAVADSDADLEAFAKGLIDFLVIHPASAGHGLNDMHLSGSETVIWFGLTANLEWYQQLNARLIGGIRRIGKNVTIHHLLCDNTIDWHYFQILKDKDACQDDLTRVLADKAKGVL